MEKVVRLNPTDAQKRMVAGRQSYKCANNLIDTIKGIETYKCPLWHRTIEDNQGSFDQSGFELDHINELATSGDNSLDNFQALCKSCHSVKTKKFLMKKSNNAYHRVYGKYICKQGDHYIYLADSLVVTEQSKIWSKNRPCDELRVAEIEKYISTVNYVDGMIYFANIEGEGLVCYDGNHRRCALMNLPKNYKILINVLENPSFEYLKEKFISLNKCVPVTELFLNKDETPQNSIDVIMEATDYFCKIWKSHRKTSPNPNRPNFNRDMLQSKIVGILELDNSLNINNIFKQQIIDCVNKYNLKLQNKKYDIKCTRSMRDKCISSGCFVFLEKRV
jgi:hypothetical protein